MKLRQSEVEELKRRAQQTLATSKALEPSFLIAAAAVLDLVEGWETLGERDDELESLRQEIEILEDEIANIEKADRERGAWK